MISIGYAQKPPKASHGVESIFLSKSVVWVHVSYAHRKIEMAMERTSLIFYLSAIFLSFHNIIVMSFDKARSS